jgi:hypothetical protein
VQHISCEIEKQEQIGHQGDMENAPKGISRCEAGILAIDVPMNWKVWKPCTR